MIRCPHCRSENPPGFQFCGSCGKPLGQICPTCAAEAPAGFKFCGSCGAALTPSPATATATSAVSSTERRRVAVLCADLVGFSTLAEQLDPEPLNTLVTETLAALTAEVERRGGAVENFAGDALVAVFGAPQAHEDDPERAVAAAMAMHEVIEHRSRTTPTPLQIRIGVNSGLVVAGATGDGRQTGVLGDAVNIAARLQQAAAPGELLVAASVWRRVRDRYQAEAIGMLQVRGRAQEVEAYRIVGAATPSVRRRAPFIGRTEESALLDILWSSAAKGNTHLVSVVGEPGVGKSRLLAQFAPVDATLELRVGCTGERAFGPFLDLVQQIVGRPAQDVDDLKRQFATLGIDVETALLVGALLGVAGAPPVVRMADEQQKRQVFVGVWQFLLAVGAGKPTLLVLEDVHWADRSSLDLLGFLLERLTGVPLMLVMTYRPGFDHVERTALRASHTAIRLEPLNAAESIAVARGFLGCEWLPEDLEGIVAGRAEGNPFFIEELLQALLDLESLAIIDGRAVLAKVQIDIPDTVQGTILARVDRLPAAERALLQQLAVIGRSFSTDFVRAVTGRADVGKSLEVLARAQLLDSTAPEQWSFKHALIQEVVYETLLLRKRRELHAEIAAALEDRGRDDPAYLEVLAEHYAKAEVPEKARHYSTLAGDLAGERMGFVEAMARYETALRLWGTGDPAGRLDVLYKIGHASFLGGDMSRARTTLIEARAGWEQLGDSRQVGQTLAMLGRVYWGSGDVERATDVLREAIAILTPLGPSPELALAYAWASTSQMLVGQIDAGAELARKGLEIEKPLGLIGIRSNLLNTLGVCQANAGNMDGLDRLHEALELAERSGEAQALGRAYTNYPDTLSRAGRHEEALAIDHRGREAMRKLGAPNFEWFIAGNEAAVLMNLGRYEEAEALLKECLDPERASLSVPGQVNASTWYADLLIRQGKYGDARGVLDDVTPMARRIGGPEYLAPSLALDAQLEHARGNLAAARQSIAESVDILLSSPSVTQTLYSLVPASQLLAPDRVAALLAQADPARGNPLLDTTVLEAQAWMNPKPEVFREAAGRYAAFKMPYEEARCRLEAGEIAAATELIARLRLANGPLGARRRQLADQAGTRTASPA